MTLERFVEAQAPVYDSALAELRRGDKQGHWMWFVLPQLAGLGHSPTAQRFGLAGPDEARAYLAHAVLGPRLRECVQALLDLPVADAEAVLGHTDALKLRSCLTLFAAVSGEPLFGEALAAYYDGPDPRTTALLLASGA